MILFNYYTSVLSDARTNSQYFFQIEVKKLVNLFKLKNPPK